MCGNKIRLDKFIGLLEKSVVELQRKFSSVYEENEDMESNQSLSVKKVRFTFSAGSVIEKALGKEEEVFLDFDSNSNSLTGEIEIFPLEQGGYQTMINTKNQVNNKE